MTTVPDGWATESGSAEEYALDRIYLAASDRRGHSERVSARMPPELLSGLSRAISSGKLPGYASVSDFIRDAAFHRLHFWREKMAGGWEPQLTAAMALAEIEAKRTLLKSHRALITTADELLQNAIQEADLSMLAEAIAFAREAGAELGQPWKQQLDEIATRAEQHEGRLRQLRRM